MEVKYLIMFLIIVGTVIFFSIELSEAEKYMVKEEKKKKERQDYADELIAKIPEHENTI